MNESTKALMEKRIELTQSRNSLKVVSDESMRRIEFAALIMAKPNHYTENDLSDYFMESVSTVRRDALELRKSGIRICSKKRKYYILDKWSDLMLNKLICKYMALNKYDHIKNLTLIRKKYKDETLLIFVNILNAITKRHILHISYGKKDNESVRKEVSPISLTRNGRDVYLIALENDNPNKPRIYRMDKIDSVEFTDGKTRNRFYPDIYDMFKYAWGIFLGGREYDVELKFNKEVGDDFATKFYIEEQDISEFSDYYVLKMKVKVSYDFISWVMGWGGLVEVIKPEMLKEAILLRAREIIQKYDK
ncbi:MAG: WYL domain-containing transcriptional regulator [Ignavibacteriae bacterium]|nr:WYL domain-containing transcriptional regulator [Ignavibacteriota bacterium]